MKKKTYIPPAVKVRRIMTGSTLLAASSVVLGFGGIDPDGKEADAKNYDYTEEDPTPVIPTFSLWDD